MKQKPTHLLSDDPASADELGTHRRIALLLHDEIRTGQGRSIALVGDWGSGKSTIIELLRNELGADSTTKSHLFVYDAWSHQGDSLRRAFLDDFVASLRGKLKNEDVEDASDKVWNRSETTTTTKEPVLRRHAKAFLLTLGLAAIGMRLIDLPSGVSLIESLTQTRNIIASIFVLSPVFLISILVGLRCFRHPRLNAFLFGDNWSQPGFSVLNFFFEKTQGQIERKHTKNPVDSVRAFREIFEQIVSRATTHESNLRIVIVIDNIDRIPSDQAREFWSTMQTFFGYDGNYKRFSDRKYWLVAPFSVEALSFIFRDGGFAITSKISDTESDALTEARMRAKAYIDKTFGLAFFVPPPILTNWRRYLLEKLRTSFPEHSENDLLAVRDSFDFAQAGKLTTPREMKLFVNSLVALYRQRGEDVSLPIMAIYLIHRNRISGADIPDYLLDWREIRQIDDDDWRTPLAALHFGVSLTDATQLLLQEPILAALRAGSMENLAALEGRPGFLDILPKVVELELRGATVNDGGEVARAAATVAALSSASKPELVQVWRALRRSIRSAGQWSGVQKSTADGLKAILIHTPELEKAQTCKDIASSLSLANLGEPPNNYKGPYISGKLWLDSAISLLVMSAPDRTLRISLPGDERMKIELLQQLADMDAAADIRSAFDVGDIAGGLGRALASEIAVGRFPRNHASLIKFLAGNSRVSMNWSAITKACADRLRTNDLGNEETRSLTVLMLAVGIWHSDGLSGIRHRLKAEEEACKVGSVFANGASNGCKGTVQCRARPAGTMAIDQPSSGPVQAPA